jgi:hypothetical protein
MSCGLFMPIPPDGITRARIPELESSQPSPAQLSICFRRCLMRGTRRRVVLAPQSPHTNASNDRELPAESGCRNKKICLVQVSLLLTALRCLYPPIHP